MPANKGLVNAYDFALSCIDSSLSFYEWITDEPNKFHAGQICEAPAWYEKRNRWFFIDEHYDPIKEEESTWKARIFTGKEREMDEGKYTFVKKYFDLEKDEKLIATHTKYRPVVLIRFYESSWHNPGNSETFLKNWLCLPVFSYKSRHNQEYVLNDQRFLNPDRIYMPPAYKNIPGINLESAIQLQAIQMVNENYLMPLKSFCNTHDPKMNRPFKVSNLGIKIILFHLFKNLNIFQIFQEKDLKNELLEENNLYYNFVEIVDEYIKESWKEIT